jgi:hypothetical protein
MKTILQHAQGLVYNLLCLMPSPDQKASLKALFGLFLEQQGHALPEQTPLKSASSLNCFLNHYHWSTCRVIPTTRQAAIAAIVSAFACSQCSREDIDRSDHVNKDWEIRAFEYPQRKFPQQ